MRGEPMAKPKRARKTIKVRDLSAKKDAKGGGKKKQQDKQEFLVVKMTDIVIT